MSTTMTTKTADLSHLLEPQEMSRDALKRLIALAERPGTKLVNWERLGTPHPDRIIATIDVPVADVGQAVHDAFTITGLRAKVIGFPNGIPTLDAVRLHVEATAR